MTDAIAWALVSAFVLGFLAGGLFAAALIVAVRVKVGILESRRRDDTLRRRYQFPTKWAGQ